MIDRAAALARVGGDMDLLREIAGVFLEEYSGTLADLRNAIEAADARKVERYAHALKGCISTFGTGPVFETALAIEQQGRCGDLTGISQKLSDLECGLNQMTVELQALVAE